jgi:1-deoxy-D-xylulose-5-phosphate reductoisomerase
MSERKNVVLLGATGSIGENTLKVIRQHSDRLNLIGIAARANREKLAAIAKEFHVAETALFIDEGEEGLTRLATLPEADVVLVAATGTVGIRPTIAALRAGKDIALASKEVMVAAGRFVMEAAHRNHGAILPVDSEHNAIFQCLDGNPQPRYIRRLLLTASGGALRDLPLDQMEKVTVEDALRHPNWDMGPKVTIDSATMANKGLEMIEARWLFEVLPEQIEVVIHPQSLVHSMVEYRDGSIIAQLSPPSMTFAIQHALLYPERAPGVNPTIDFSQLVQLEFRPPDAARYPCLQLAREAMFAGGLAPAAFNAANEIAVEAFVANRLPFLAIPRVISDCLEQLHNFEPSSLDALLSAESEIREATQALIAHYGRS